MSGGRLGVGRGEMVGWVVVVWDGWGRGGGGWEW